VQTVFADLARKAKSLRSETTLGGWLHRHTCFVSSNHLRAERRRLAREQEAMELHRINQSPENVWLDIEPVLDDAINQLSSKDRQAIILRFYERLDFASVGNALGTNADAAQKRVSRALERLRPMLKGRNVTVGTGLLSSLLIDRALTAAPIDLAQSVSESAVS